MPGEPTAGYNCGFCGQWVNSGVFHQCVTIPPVQTPNMYTSFFPQNTVFSAIDYEKIRQIIREEIAKALADQKQLGSGS